MIIKDSIFGSRKVDGVKEQLIKSRAVRRLKGIAQQGTPKEFLPKGMPAYTRFEHSIGCMLLLERLGADEEEQIAGLLHDISHTAFSHAADWAFGDMKKENLQDERHADYFLEGEISHILKKNGYDPHRIGNLTNFRLLERETPDLCADRVENGLRYLYYMGDFKLIRDSLRHLLVYDNEIVFDSSPVALRFSMGYLSWQPEFGGWGGMGRAIWIRWYLLGHALKLAHERGIITMKDLDSTDAAVIKKMMKSGDGDVLRLLKMLKHAEYSVVERNGIKFVQKFRYVDPKCVRKSGTVRLSTINHKYKRILEDARKRNKAGITVKIIGM